MLDIHVNAPPHSNDSRDDGRCLFRSHQNTERNRRTDRCLAEGEKNQHSQRKHLSQS